jgi:hypothetical protein
MSERLVYFIECQSVRLVTKKFRSFLQLTMVRYRILPFILNMRAL